MWPSPLSVMVVSRLRDNIFESSIVEIWSTLLLIEVKRIYEYYSLPKKENFNFDV